MAERRGYDRIASRRIWLLAGPSCILKYGLRTSEHQRSDSLFEMGSTDAKSHDSEVAESSHESATPLRTIRDYNLTAKIGQGGMGTVYRGSHRIMQREVAIKVLPADRMNDEESVSRFHREIQAVAKLQRPNIVQAHDAGEENGTHYFVMEYVPGLDLGAVVKRIGPLPVPDACELIRQAADGLQHAHEHGMVHRDIKPSNLLLSRSSPPRRMDALVRPASSDKPTPSGSDEGVQATVKILDLGLALLSEADRAVSQHLTSTGQIMGTLDYMAPEQADDTHAVDIRADIYSLGCTLYALLAGEPPFGGQQFTTPVRKLAAHMQKPVPPIRDKRDDVPDELVAVLDRMLAKQPGERFATPGEVATALQSLVASSDLPQLLERATETQPKPNEADSSSHETRGQASSPFTATRPSQSPADIEATTDHVSVDATLASSPARNSRRVKPLLVTAILITLALVVCGVIINQRSPLAPRLELSSATSGNQHSSTPSPAPTRQELTSRSDVATIEEPPPLKEWLQDREVITVAKDGSGQFDTIQAALDVLKPGQVVRVVDKGPYRETLDASSLASNVGLVSSIQTVIEADQWTKGDDDAPLGHVIDGADQLRVSGLHFRIEDVDAFRCLVIRNSVRVTIDDCCFSAAPQEQAGITRRAISILANPHAAAAEHNLLIQNCCFVGAGIGGVVYPEGAPPVVSIQQNLFRGKNYMAIGLTSADRFRRFNLHGNVIDVAGLLSAIQIGTDGLDTAGELRITSNTLRRGVIQFHTSQIAKVNVQNNCVDGITFQDTATRLAAEQRSGWHIDHNAFAPRKTDPEYVDPREKDIVLSQRFLANDSREENDLRIALDGPLADSGAGGDLPVYIGALPPGPAPPEGDWFTRLQERWKDVVGNTDQPVQPAGKMIRPEDDWVDLLPHVDLDHDRFAGNWEIEDGNLVGSRDDHEHGRVLLPVVPQGNYRLKVKFIRREGNEIVGVILPIENRQFAVLLSAWAGQHGGLHMVDGHSILSDQSPAAMRPSKLENGDLYLLEVAVTTRDEQALINVTLNGQPYVSWNGELSGLSNDPVWQLPRSDTPAVCYRDCKVEYQEIQLKMLDGTAQLLRPRPTDSISAEHEITEPPPLEEWLEGREILTVKQNGTAMFTKIQDALDALKPGQVVEVLDKGPYRETLDKQMPADTGFITRVSTWITLADWRELNADPDYEFFGHLLQGQLRIHGFTFSSDSRPNSKLLRVEGTATIEECVFPDNHTDQAPRRDLNFSVSVPTQPSVIRDCAFGGNVSIGLYSGATRLIVERNYFLSPNYGVGINCSSGSGDSHWAIVRDNIFSELTEHAAIIGAAGGPCNLTGRFEGNTVLCRYRLLTVTLPLPESPFTIRRNLVIAREGVVAPVKSGELVDERILRDRNLFAVAPTNAHSLPLSPTDILGKPTFLSDDPSSPNYARPDPKTLPSLTDRFGALPPGPAPPEGDWFTRLQERWKEAQAAKP